MSNENRYEYSEARMPWGARGAPRHPGPATARESLDLVVHGLTTRYGPDPVTPLALGGIDLGIAAAETVR